MSPRKGIDHRAVPAVVLRDPGTGDYFAHDLDGPSPTVMAYGLGGASSRQVGLTNAAGPDVDEETGRPLTFNSNGQIARFTAPNAVRKFSLAEVRRLCGFPDDFILTGTYNQRWERLGRAVPPVMMSHIAAAVRDQILLPVAYNPGGSDTMAVPPPYQVPSMDEIRALPWNGLNAVSTFSGCGGSSLGYRMAGYRVLWANEFVEAARDTYEANAAPYTIVDGRDIREVTPDDILAAVGMKAGQLDLFDGSPPCASFSTAGKRHKGWGQVNKYSDTEQRSDDLFYEYARLVKGVQPRVFIAENVSGLVKGTAKGYFKEITVALRRCGYRVAARVLDAQWLGVPQARQRLIFIGVREDLDLDPVHPSPLPYRYTVRDALPHILAQGDNGGYGGGSMREATVPSPTIGASPQTGNGRFPPSAVITAVHDTSGDRSTGDMTDRPCPTITVGVNAVNSLHYRIVHDSGGQFNSAGIITDRPCPTIKSGASGGDARQYRVEGPGHAVDPETGKNIGGAAVSPGTVRKFTLAELRRICGFPDDFILTGTYEQRWERLGRAVPPVMMSHVAAAVRDQILAVADGQEAA